MRKLLAATSFLASAAALAVTPADDVDYLRDLIRNQKYQEAVDQGRRMLDDRQRLHGEGAPQVAEILAPVAQAMALGRIGEPERRRELAERVLAIRRATPTTTFDELAEALYTVGLERYHAGEYSEALEAFVQAGNQVAEGDRAGHPRYYAYLRERGAALFELGSHDEALDVYERLRSLIEDKFGARSAEMVGIYRTLGLIATRLGDYARAKAWLDDALSVLDAQPGPRVSDRSELMNSTNNLMFLMGKTEQAITQNEQLLAFRREHFGPRSEEVAETSSNLATMLSQVGDYEEALRHFRNCIQILDATEVKPTLPFTSNLGLAIAYERTGELTVALEHYRRAEIVGRRIFEDPDNPQWRDFLIHFGSLKRELGEIAEAKRLLRHAARILPENADLAFAHDGLGRVALTEGKVDEAIDHAEKARALALEKVGGGHPMTIGVIGGLGIAYLAAGDVERAFDTAVEAETLSTRMTTALISVLPERRAVGLAGQPQVGLDLALTVATTADLDPERKRKALDIVVRSRARVFDEMAARRRWILAEGDPELVAKREALHDARNERAGLWVRGPLAGYGLDFARELREADARVETIEQDLARESEPYRRQLASRNFGLDELIDSLPPDTAVVSYVRFGRLVGEERSPSYAAFVIRRDRSTPSIVDLGPASEIESVVGDWRELFLSLPGLRRDHLPLGRTLRRLIWDPVVRPIGEVGQVIVVPAGALHQVSLAALPLDGDRYLIETGPLFHYLTAERDLLRLEGPALSTGALMALGNPAFERGAGRVAEGTYRSSRAQCDRLWTEGWGSLPGTLEEAELVSKIWQRRGERSPRTLMLGIRATEGRFKTKAPKHEVLHLATHGFYLGEECGTAPADYRGIGGLAPKRADRPAAVPQQLVNPLLLSGLVMAGANRRYERRNAEDGIVMAEEIAALDLEQVQWAVLSACQSGAGAIAGNEGLFGLRRAFQIAGVDTVITNLWEVHDFIGRNFMEALYTYRFLERRTTAEAMREASLHVLNDQREKGESDHPFFWGGWMATGNPN